MKRLLICGDDCIWYSVWDQPKRNKSADSYYCRCARYARIQLEGLGSSFSYCETYGMSMLEKVDGSARQSIEIWKKRRRAQKGANAVEGANTNNCKTKWKRSRKTVEVEVRVNLMKNNSRTTSRRRSATRWDDKALYTKSATTNEAIRERSTTVREDKVAFELETMWGNRSNSFSSGALCTGLLYYKNRTNRDI